jgi:hypothetical protein
MTLGKTIDIQFDEEVSNEDVKKQVHMFRAEVRVQAGAVLLSDM